MDTFSNIPGIALLDCDHELPHIRCCALIDGFVAVRREYISLHAPHCRIGVSWRLADQPPLPPLTRDVVKAVLRFALSSFGFFLLSFPSALRSAIGSIPFASAFRASECRSRASFRLTRGYSPSAIIFSLPSTRYRQRQSLAPDGGIRRQRPPPSASLQGLSVGFAPSISLIVSAMGPGSLRVRFPYPQISPMIPTSVPTEKAGCLCTSSHVCRLRSRRPAIEILYKLFIMICL